MRLFFPQALAGSGKVAGVLPYSQTLVLPDGASNIADRIGG